jgi:hypothetical protein
MILKKHKGPICYLKNLKDLYDTNIQFKGPIDVFGQKKKRNKKKEKKYVYV